MNTGHLVMTFSEAVNAGTLTPTGITLQDAATKTFASLTLTGGTTASSNGTAIDVAMTPADVTAIKANGFLAKAKGSSYLIITSAVIQDLAGNNVTAISDGSAVNVTTYGSDTTAPTVSSIYPVDGTTNVAVSVLPYINFSKPMNASTITSSTVQLKAVSGGAAVTATVTLTEGNQRAIITPSSALSPNAQYYLYVSTGAQDAAGNAIAEYNASGTIKFTTAGDTTAPVVSSFTPTVGVTGVAITVQPTVTFSKTMDTPPSDDHGPLP